MAYRLSFLSGPLRGARRDLQRRRIDLGNDLACQIWLDDPSIAPQHAEMEIRGSGVYVRAVVPDRPIQVNGIEVQEALLAPGDELGIGESRIRFGNAPGSWVRVVPAVGLAIALITGLLLGARIFLKRALDRGEPIPAVVRSPAPPKPPEVVTPGLKDMERIDAGLSPTPAPPAPGPTPAASAPTVPAIPPTPDVPPPPAAIPDIPAAEPPSALPAPTPAAPAAPQPSEAEQQAARERAARETAAAALLAAADEALRRGDAAAGDQALQRLQAEHPAYLPGIAARARRLESGNQLGAAEKLWIRVLQGSTSGPLYDEAATALARIAAKQIPDTPAPVIPDIPITPPEAPPEAPVLPPAPKPQSPPAAPVQPAPTPAPARPAAPPPATNSAPAVAPKPPTAAPATPVVPRPTPSKPQPPPAPVAALPAPAPTPAPSYRPPFSVLPETPATPTNAPAATPAPAAGVTAARPKPTTTAPRAETVDPGLRIVSIEPQRFPASPDVADMRTLRITLVPTGSTESLLPSQIRLEVQFYDLIERTGAATPSRATQSIRSEDAGETWEPGHARTYSAVYAMPRDLYDREAKRGNAPTYFGYRVRVFYNNRLQDQQAKPLTLPSRNGSLYLPVPR